MTTHPDPGDLFARHLRPTHTPHRQPPQPVIVFVSHALPGSSDTSFRDGTPLKVRAEGLSVDIKVQGALSAWARLANGAWLACVTFSVSTGNGKGHLDLQGQWVPSNAVTPMH